MEVYSVDLALTHLVALLREWADRGSHSLQVPKHIFLMDFDISLDHSAFALRYGQLIVSPDESPIAHVYGLVALRAGICFAIGQIQNNGSVVGLVFSSETGRPLEGILSVGSYFESLLQLDESEDIGGVLNVVLGAALIVEFELVIQLRTLHLDLLYLPNLLCNEIFFLLVDEFALLE